MIDEDRLGCGTNWLSLLGDSGDRERLREFDGVQDICSNAYSEGPLPIVVIAI